jgi:hypothetical protein
MTETNDVPARTWEHLNGALQAFETAESGPQYEWHVPPFEELPLGSTSQERAISLRRGLADKFRVADGLRKRSIGAFYVQEFGGISADKRRTSEAASDDLARFCLDDPANLLNGFRRVSSWSKVLSIRDPDVYLIYDSRVAKSLNWLQLRHLGSIQAYFPIPPRRSLTPMGGRLRYRPNDESIRAARGTAALLIRRAAAYPTYLRLMAEAQPDPHAREKLEMKLFAQADFAWNDAAST